LAKSPQHSLSHKKNSSIKRQIEREFKENVKIMMAIQHDNSTFAKQEQKFTVDLKGKTILMTGSSTGLHKQLAMVLAKRGAHLVLASRSKSKTMRAINDIKAYAPESKVEFMAIDLTRLETVKNFVERIKKKCVASTLSLYACIFNLSILKAPEKFTVGFEGKSTSLFSMQTNKGIYFRIRTHNFMQLPGPFLSCSSPTTSS
jgi:isocitrate lyase